MMRQFAIAAQLMRAYPRDMAILAAVLFGSAPVCVVAVNICAAILKGPQP